MTFQPEASVQSTPKNVFFCWQFWYKTFSVFLLSIQYFSRENLNGIIHVAAESDWLAISIGNTFSSTWVQHYSPIIPLHEYAGERSCNCVTAKRCVSLSSAISQLMQVAFDISRKISLVHVLSFLNKDKFQLKFLTLKSNFLLKQEIF